MTGLSFTQYDFPRLDKGSHHHRVILGETAERTTCRNDRNVVPQVRTLQAGLGLI